MEFSEDVFLGHIKKIDRIRYYESIEDLHKYITRELKVEDIQKLIDLNVFYFIELIIINGTPEDVELCLDMACDIVRKCTSNETQDYIVSKNFVDCAIGLMKADETYSSLAALFLLECASVFDEIHDYLEEDKDVIKYLSSD